MIFGVILGIVWEYFGMILDMIWDDFGMIFCVKLGWFWNAFGTIWE
jgi:hypothetical protein